MSRLSNPFKKYYGLDSTPRYLYDPKAAQRIYDFNPKMKLIILLRNPVHRAYSAYQHYLRQYENYGKNTKLSKILEEKIKILPEFQLESFLALINQDTFPTFEEMVQAEIKQIETQGINLYDYPDIVKRGFYALQIKEYLKFFALDNIFIIQSEKFKSNQKVYLDKIVDFLEIPDFNWSKLKFKNKHLGKYQKAIDPSIELKLKDYYRPYNQNLFQLIGQEFAW